MLLWSKQIECCRRKDQNKSLRLGNQLKYILSCDLIVNADQMIQQVFHWLPYAVDLLNLRTYFIVT